MGLAASQARLLLLTARKNDLEYRAQQITNAEMILAMQTEQVAREYSIKISNQTIIYQDANDKDQTSKKITASTLKALTGGGYRLQIRDSENPDEWYDWTKFRQTNDGWIDKDGNVITDAQYANLSATDKAECKRNRVDTADLNNDYTGPEILEGYNNGTIKIVDANGDDVDLNSNNGFVTTYYTDDDRAAEAEYNTKTAAIQVKEKRLQNDLNQVQTQQKACDTEIDSVKKIMDKNIERTFKVFS